MTAIEAMTEFSGKVAVVTGAASGIGRALVDRCAREGMRVVLADVEAAPLEGAVADLRNAGHSVLGVVTDVSKAESVERLARRTMEAFGAVHLVCNNAGVLGGRGGPIWDATYKDWQWILGVNVWGVIHGIHTFVPRMLAQGDPGWIVNTASMGGLVPGLNPYGVSKHAVVAISEALYSQLKVREASVGCSVLCPIFIRTRIREASRNRPSDLLDENLPPVDPLPPSPLSGRIESGQPPSDMADAVFEGLRTGQFWIFPGDEVDNIVRRRMEHILARTNPDPRPFG
jgi:NAD(P)-dependent dehydrogenase (short-subunit alcohol dehydrogenase family)